MDELQGVHTLASGVLGCVCKMLNNSGALSFPQMSVTDIRCDQNCHRRGKDRCPGHASHDSLSKMSGKDMRGGDKNGCSERGKLV